MTTSATHRSPTSRQILAGTVVATAVAFSVGTAMPAAAAGDDQIVGIEQTVGNPDGSVIAYTVTKILPSGDPVAHPLAGQLYEATVMAKSIQGTVAPLVPFFTARAGGATYPALADVSSLSAAPLGDGATYPALADVSSLSAAPLGDGATTDGKVYFDVVGPAPTSVVFDDPPASPLTWKEPIPGDPPTGGSPTGGGSTGGGGGSQGVTGSTGPNDVSPSTSGGDIGGGEGGTEGGGGNLSSGGGSGAPSGDTGKNNGTGGPSGSGG